MLEHTPTLSQRLAAIFGATATAAHPNEGVELALFRAREALEAGWQLTPDEAVALVGAKSNYAGQYSGPWSQSEAECEDEVADIPLYFGEN